MSKAKSQRRTCPNRHFGASWFLCVAATTTICGPETAIAEVSTSGLSAQVLWSAKPSGGSLLRGSGKLTGKYESDLRRLEGDIRPSASRQLVRLSTQHDVLNDPTRRLALIRALAKHETKLDANESARLEIVRVLLRLFAAEDEIGLDRAELESGAIRHLARGTAAMALARSRHPLALKKLLAMALRGDELDPVGAHLAVTALRSLPDEALHKPELLRLFSVAAIAKIFASENHSSLALGHGAKVSTETLTPKALVLASKGFESAYRKPRTESTVSDSPLDSLSFEAMITLLLKERSLPRTFARVKSWEEARKEDPVWTLRALALLGSRVEKPILDWGKRTALRATRARSKLERSAGAWCSVTIAPDSALELLQRGEPVITRAVLHQASEGKVGEIVTEFLKKKNLDPEATHLGFGMVFQDPERWSSFSTAFLRQHQAENSPAVLAALSSRLRAAGGGLGPDVSEVQSWLVAASTEVRSAAALGLSEAPSSSALGLLSWAYRKESDPQTRRAIVASIARTPLSGNADFLDLLALDPDPQCRELLRRGSMPDELATEAAKRTESRVYINWSARRTATVTDREGRTLELAPAPDGFVGVVRSSF